MGGGGAEGEANRPTEATPAGGAVIAGSGLLRDAWYRFVRNRGALLAGIGFILLVLAAVLIPIVSPHDPHRVDFTDSYLGLSETHPFGTDRFGRDMLTRTALGTRVSLLIGMAATVVILLIGITYGAFAGFVGGRLDNALMRLLDSLYGLPYLPFAIITLQIFGVVNIFTMVIALSVVSWFTPARIVRGQVITLKENDYVRAAKAIGVRWYRVLWRHIMPNTLGVIVIAIFLELPAVILGEAFLSFIGLGINPPEASLGSLAQDGLSVYRQHPHLIVIPSLVIAALVLCANFVADGLRDALDPRTQKA